MVERQVLVAVHGTQVCCVVLGQGPGEFGPDADVVDDLTPLLVRVETVGAGHRLEQSGTGERAVEVEDLLDGGVEAGEQHGLDDEEGHGAVVVSGVCRGVPGAGPVGVPRVARRAGPPAIGDVIGPAVGRRLPGGIVRGGVRIAEAFLEPGDVSVLPGLRGPGLPVLRVLVLPRGGLGDDHRGVDGAEQFFVGQQVQQFLLPGGCGVVAARVVHQGGIESLELRHKASPGCQKRVPIADGCLPGHRHDLSTEPVRQRGSGPVPQHVLGLVRDHRGRFEDFLLAGEFPQDPFPLLRVGGDLHVEGRVQDGLLDDLQAHVVGLVAYGDDGPVGFRVAQRVGVGEASEDVLGGLARLAENRGSGEADQYGVRQHGAQPGVLPGEVPPVCLVDQDDDVVSRIGDPVLHPVLLVRGLGELLLAAVPGGVVPARLLEHHQGDVGDVDGEVLAGLLDRT